MIIELIAFKPSLISRTNSETSCDGICKVAAIFFILFKKVENSNLKDVYSETDKLSTSSTNLFADATSACIISGSIRSDNNSGSVISLPCLTKVNETLTIPLRVEKDIDDVKYSRSNSPRYGCSSLPVGLASILSIKLLAEAKDCSPTKTAVIFKALALTPICLI